jgi:hypothetical protein
VAWRAIAHIMAHRARHLRTCLIASWPSASSHPELAPGGSELTNNFDRHGLSLPKVIVRPFSRYKLTELNAKMEESRAVRSRYRDHFTGCYCHQVDNSGVRRDALGTMLFSIFLVRASELANTTRTCLVGFNTRPIPRLKIYAQMSSWMT